MLNNIQWNTDTKVLDTNGNEVLNDIRNTEITKELNDLTFAENNSKYIDLSKYFYSGSVLTFTDVATDQYSNSYNLQIKIGDIIGSQNGESPIFFVTNPKDGSFEFQVKNSGNFPFTISFVKNGETTGSKVIINQLISDIDNDQYFETTFGNLATVTDSGSKLDVSKNGATTTITSSANVDFGFNSTPEGTAMMLSDGTEFLFNFYQIDYNETYKGTPQGAADSGMQMQVNLFGNANVVKNYVSSSSVNYHYNVSSVITSLPLSAKRLIQVSFADFKYYRAKKQLKKPDT